MCSSDLNGEALAICLVVPTHAALIFPSLSISIQEKVWHTMYLCFQCPIHSPNTFKSMDKHWPFVSQSLLMLPSCFPPQAYQFRNRSATLSICISNALYTPQTPPNPFPSTGYLFYSGYPCCLHISLLDHIISL